LTAIVSTRICPPTSQAAHAADATAAAATGLIANDGVGGGQYHDNLDKKQQSKLYWQLQLQQQHLQLAVTERSSSK
jgi:hypothetical protein